MSVSVGAWRFAPCVEASAVGRPTCVRTFETSLRRLEIEHGVRQVG